MKGQWGRDKIRFQERGSRARREREIARNALRGVPLPEGTTKHVRRLLAWRRDEWKQKLRPYPRGPVIKSGPFKGWYELGYIDKTEEYFQSSTPADPDAYRAVRNIIREGRQP